MKSELDRSLRSSKEKSNRSELPSECTTIIVGSKQTDNGAMILARSEDWDGMIAKNLEIYPDKEQGPKHFVARDSGFKCDLPKKAYGYTALAPYHLPGHWGSAGFNTQGVGMSATESIFSNEKALKADPMEPDCIAENSVYNITLPYIRSAREGVERLGRLIEKHGVSEGFGVGFIDKEEIWYLETGSGHRWMAARIPEDVYFVTGNQGRLREYDPKDTKNFLGSKDLIEFAEKHDLYNKERDGKFDYHNAYMREEELDTTYNHPRVWGIQNRLTADCDPDLKQFEEFPVYAKADEKIDMTKMRDLFRFHYQGTEHDPYPNYNPKEPFRPVSIFRTTQTHILQVRPDLPRKIGQINYVAFGMADLSPFIPFYAGLEEFHEAYTLGTNESSIDSAYWAFRKVQALGMVDYNKYAPMIKEAILDWEATTDERQKEMEKEYLRLKKNGNKHMANDLLQDFQYEVQESALCLADNLIEKLFTELSKNIQETYLFHGA